jgi:hypothetical protein
MKELERAPLIAMVVISEHNADGSPVPTISSWRISNFFSLSLVEAPQIRSISQAEQNYKISALPPYFACFPTAIATGRSGRILSIG